MYIYIYVFTYMYLYIYIYRVRAHCYVEMTLDRCVQRLRRRIAIEELHEDRHHIDRSDSASTDKGNRRKKRGLIRDRTPSFYTSRSILHLSGLSVADPCVESQSPVPTSSSRGSNGDSSPSSSSLSPLGVPVRETKGDLALGPPISPRLGRKHSFNMRRVSNQTTPAGGSSMEFDKPINWIDYADGNSSNCASQDDGDDDGDIDSEEDVMSPSIQKTTSMANFYYKKSQSSEELLSQLNKTINDRISREKS
jgi:hypothetical protein